MDIKEAGNAWRKPNWHPNVKTCHHEQSSWLGEAHKETRAASPRSLKEAYKKCHVIGCRDTRGIKVDDLNAACYACYSLLHRTLIIQVTPDTNEDKLGMYEVG